jgi:hypothetical protein
MFKNFNGFANLKYGISQKSDGSMKVFGDDLNKKSRESFCASLNIRDFVSAGLVHGTAIHYAAKSDTNRIIPGTDGLITKQHDQFLTVTVADCFPVYLYNPVLNIVGLFHSGWRGTVGNIASRGIKTIGGNPAEIFAGIGPGIGPCHFEIKKDTLREFVRYPEAVKIREGKFFVNLPMIITKQLTTGGLKKGNIENCGECTYCLSNKYFSYRRDKPREIEAMIAYIGISN